MSVVRAAFDVGSGATKLTVAIVDPKKLLVEAILFEEETEVLLGHDYKQSTDGALSTVILSKAFNAIKHYRDLASIEYNASHFTGIATAVFRESTNGGVFISQVSQELGISLKVIDQAEEGRLGYLTGQAAHQEHSKRTNAADRAIVSWDSGGASFQICALEAEGEAGLSVFQGKWGSSKVTHAMVADVQRRSFQQTQTCNPCTLDDVTKLCRLVNDSLPEPPHWLRDRIASGCDIVAIGGATSMARVVNLATGSCDFTPETVWRAIQELVGKTDEELGHIPQPPMVLPKLALCHTVMTKFGIARARYYPCNGSTLGILISPQYWQ